MIDIVDLGLAIFWLGLAIVFFEMARTSQNMRDRLSGIFEKANIASSQEPGINQLQPIIRHMLSVDVNGFRISAAAAFVEFALVVYHLLF